LFPRLFRWAGILAVCFAGGLPAGCAKQVSPTPPTPPGLGDVPPSDVPALTNVRATINGDSVAIKFDPGDGAQDYRVYAAPKSSDILDGGRAIRNAIYRCSGDREAPVVPTDSEPPMQGGALQTFVAHAVQGFTRTAADATLGYVYRSAGAGLTPVYALGDPAPDGDNLCFFHRFNESRVKRYTTSSSDRAQLLSAVWRDAAI